MNRELDALVAEKVFGKRVSKKDEYGDGNWHVIRQEVCLDSDGNPDPYGAFEEFLDPLPNYSRDISAAFKVLEEIEKKSQGWWFWELSSNVCRWYQSGQESEGLPFVAERGDCTAQAICLAAIKAVGK